MNAKFLKYTFILVAFSGTFALSSCDDFLDREKD